jgi:hypothetical protein
MSAVPVSAFARDSDNSPNSALNGSNPNVSSSSNIIYVQDDYSTDGGNY